MPAPYLQADGVWLDGRVIYFAPVKPPACWRGRQNTGVCLSANVQNGSSAQPCISTGNTQKVYLG